MSYPQIIIILKLFEDFFACKIALAANHHYPENIQRLLRLQNCLRRKISLSWKYSKTFFRLQNCLPRNSSLSWKHSTTFRLHKCLSRKTSLSWDYSKTFAPAELSYLQIIFFLKIFKDFSACKIGLAAKLHYPENIQRLFHQQKCLNCKSSLFWKYSKTFSPAKLSLTQIIIILKTFKDLVACKNVLAENHHYPGNIQRLFCLQKCLSCKSSLSWGISKTFLPAKLS